MLLEAGRGVFDAVDAGMIGRGMQGVNLCEVGYVNMCKHKHHQN